MTRPGIACNLVALQARLLQHASSFKHHIGLQVGIGQLHGTGQNRIVEGRALLDGKRIAAHMLSACGEYTGKACPPAGGCLTRNAAHEVAREIEPGRFHKPRGLQGLLGGMRPTQAMQLGVAKRLHPQTHTRDAGTAQSQRQRFAQ